MSHADNGTYTVIVQITDGAGAVGTDGLTVTVASVAPMVGPITGPTGPVQFSAAVNSSANFTDPGAADTHTAVWDWGDGNTSAGPISGATVSGSHTYAGAGVYTVELTVEDDDGGIGASVLQFVVVYDSQGCFVTGGGWIASPAGAYVADPSMTGRANFGFVSKYHKGGSDRADGVPAQVGEPQLPLRQRGHLTGPTRRRRLAEDRLSSTRSRPEPTRCD